MDSLEWQEGFDLPSNLGYAGHVDFGDTNLIIGGYDFDEDFHNSILIWNPNNLTWSALEERMSVPSDRMCAVLVDESKVDCS